MTWLAQKISQKPKSFIPADNFVKARFNPPRLYFSRNIITESADLISSGLKAARSGCTCLYKAAADCLVPG